MNDFRVDNCLKKRHRITPEPKFLAVDFFCGAGGTARGLIDAGGYLIAGIDKDPQCKKTFINNNKNIVSDRACPSYLNLDILPKSKSYPEGQQKALIEVLALLIGCYREKYPKLPLLFTICAPCQPFTRLSRKKLTPERIAARERDSMLLREAVKFVRRFQPELVLSENVAGINDPRYGGIWEQFRKDLDCLKYVTGTKVVCASRFGIPQYRKRSILIAIQKNLVNYHRLADALNDELLVPESDPEASIVSVKEAIGHLPPLGAGAMHPKTPNHRTRSLSELNLLRIKSAKPGESNSYLEHTEYGDLSLDCHKRVNKRLQIRCFSDVYTRMHPDRPAPTITTKCHSISNGRFGHYDLAQVRGISLREAAILQSFPDDYVFYPTEQIGSVARMIGNAVPPKLAAFYANYLVNSVR